ncbi:TlpA disulfide reductase family protein [Immundisolibacter sp.]|uniref:TlpA disulfide reductase family protein n=1 Tax=Immundisolibacter sp. TaxID=1934948 RepID=UPI0026126913|nr:TlpA disulfide reductase family protein [Immundisolibacter sp.]MDD3651855.1 TlpA disulfide reductase family protein [Immundisolibacter sp.]
MCRLIACLLIAATAFAAPAHAAPERLPDDVRFTAVDGRTLDAKALRGRPLLIVFWASTCAPCIAEMPDLAALYDDLHPKGLELIALAMPYDPPNRVLAAREVLQLPFPVAIDVNATLVRRLGVPPQTPQFLLVDGAGKVVAVHDGVWPIHELRAALAPLLGKG